VVPPHSTQTAKQIRETLAVEFIEFGMPGTIVGNATTVQIGIGTEVAEPSLRMGEPDFAVTSIRVPGGTGVECWFLRSRIQGCSSHATTCWPWIIDAQSDCH